MKSKEIQASLFFLLSLMTINAQVKEEEVLTRNNQGNPKLVNLTSTDVSTDSVAVKIFIKSLFKSDDHNDFRVLSKSQIDPDLEGYENSKLQQYYKGIKVEFGQINIVSKEEKLKTVNGNFIDIKDLSVVPAFKGEEALEFAIKAISAKEYAWDNAEMEALLKQEQNNPESTHFPQGELVILENEFNSKSSIPLLAYKFDIYTTNPLGRANYYVNANNGNIILVDNLLKDLNHNIQKDSHKTLNTDTMQSTERTSDYLYVQGTAATRYSGSRTIETSLSGSQYRLRDLTRGSGIHTRNMNNGSSYLSAADLLDANNNWTAAEYNNANGDNALLDAHWGAMMTYSYFLSRHGRVGINGSNGPQILNYVNANLPAIMLNLQDSNNAFWDGSRLTYGRGTGIGQPHTSIDIVAHEIGHAIDQYTSNLVYERESGAIDEGLSDIWGAMVKFYAAPEKQTYLIGEEVMPLPYRSMQNPKLLGHPDTYGGINWHAANNPNDNFGVHTNSGILNHFFYLLAEGTANAPDRINDNGGRFNFPGIGKLDAAKIVYRAQTVHFTSNMIYADARALTIQAANQLFGANSTQAITTNNAWFAVGLGNLIAGQINGPDCACFSPNATYNLSNFTDVAQVPVWQVSSNLQIVSSNNTSITVKSISSATRAAGFIRATFAGQLIQKNIWVGAPASATVLNGPSSAAYGAIINYNGGINDIPGASSYRWYLPYPYNQNATVTTNPAQWGIISGGTTRYVQTQVGPNNGLVQFMGVNTCGVGGAITKAVTVTAGGGGIPLVARITPETEVRETVEIFPNPAKDQLTIQLPSKSKSDIFMYNMNGIEVLSQKNTSTEAQLSVALLPAGLYFIQVTGELNLIRKIIINR